MDLCHPRRAADRRGSARDDLTKILRGTLRRLFSEYNDLAVVEQMEWKGSWVPRSALEEIGVVARDATAGGVVGAPELEPNI